MRGTVGLKKGEMTPDSKTLETTLSEEELVGMVSW